MDRRVGQLFPNDRRTGEERRDLDDGGCRIDRRSADPDYREGLCGECGTLSPRFDVNIQRCVECAPQLRKES